MENVYFFPITQNTFIIVNNLLSCKRKIQSYIFYTQQKIPPVHRSELNILQSKNIKKLAEFPRFLFSALRVKGKFVDAESQREKETMAHCWQKFFKN